MKIRHPVGLCHPVLALGCIYKRGGISESSLVLDGALWICMVVRTSDDATYECVRTDIYMKEVS